MPQITQLVLESEPKFMPHLTPGLVLLLRRLCTYVCAVQDLAALSYCSHIPLLGSRALAQHGQLLMVGDEVTLVFHASDLWSSPLLLLLLLPAYLEC